MHSSILCISCFISTCIGTALFPRNDGFTFVFDGKHHLGYGVVPLQRGESVTVEFYDVDFISHDCDDVRVEVYRNGFVRQDQELISRICDAKELQDFKSSSEMGFSIQVLSSNGTLNGQIKARFAAQGGTLVVQQSFQ